jgi:hypothetical protein
LAIDFPGDRNASFRANGGAQNGHVINTRITEVLGAALA